MGGDDVVLRPMNCPHHILVFAAEPRGVREMPVRLAELGTMFRMERSGVVGGLSRVRQMTLNDGHVFCAAEHVGEEIASILGMVTEAYGALAIPAPRFRLSLRGDGPKYVGDDASWDVSEAMLRESLDAHGLPYEEPIGEAAFYGPNIDLQVQDPQGREETLSTVQVDFHLPGPFDLSFLRGERSERPVLIHRSIVSTMERMVAHVLEVHAEGLDAVGRVLATRREEALSSRCGGQVPEQVGQVWPVGWFEQPDANGMAGHPEQGVPRRSGPRRRVSGHGQQDGPGPCWGCPEPAGGGVGCDAVAGAGVSIGWGRGRQPRPMLPCLRAGERAVQRQARCRASGARKVPTRDMTEA